jgi:ketosteroid isomerase-like protein
MSQQNVEVAQRAFEAFNRGDVDALVEQVDPEVEWYPEFQTMMLGGEAREFRGHEGARAALREWYEVLAEIHLEIVDVASESSRPAGFAPAARKAAPQSSRRPAT